MRIVPTDYDMAVDDRPAEDDEHVSRHVPVPALSDLPIDIIDLTQYVNWQALKRGGRLTKVPINPHTCRPASVSDPSTWGSAEQALDVVRRHGPTVGLGLVLTSADPFTAVDLDGCLDPDTGELSARAAEIVTLLDSYTEISPSGTGLHILVRGKPPVDRQRTAGIEIYFERRYITLTGRVLDGGR